jgi:hypothetical protein
MSSNASIRPWHPAALMLVLCAGCASPIDEPAPKAPPPAGTAPAGTAPADGSSKAASADRASITEEVAAEATVLSVDKATREMTLERSDGARMVLVATPDFRNFDQVEAGMKVKAKVSLKLSVRRLAPEEKAAPPSVAAGAARARLGEKPAGGVVAGLSMTVTVQSVDAERHVVTFTDPDGALRAVKAERDEGIRFVAGLKPGDRVEIVYGEGVVLSVE